MLLLDVDDEGLDEDDGYDYGSEDILERGELFVK